MRKNDAFPAPHHRYRHGSQDYSMSILSFYILMLSIFLLLQKNTVKLENLLLIGYSPNRVALPYNILTCGLNLAVLILSVGGVAWVRSYYTEIIGALSFSATGDGDIVPMLDSRLPAMPRSIFFEYCNDTQKNHEYLERKISEPVTYIAGAGISSGFTKYVSKQTESKQSPLVLRFIPRVHP